MISWQAHPRIAVLAGLLLCMAALPVGTTGAQEWDLSGEWIIDLKESDEPAEVFEAFSERRSGRSGVGIGVGIFGIPVGEVARTGGRGTEPAEVVRRDLRKLSPHLTSTVDELSIEQSPDSLRVAYDNVDTLTYRADEPMEDSGATSHAQWRRDVYTIEHHAADDLRAVEEIYLDRRDPNRLRWNVTIELPSSRAIQIHRVFDRAPQP